MHEPLYSTQNPFPELQEGPSAAPQAATAAPGNPSGEEPSWTGLDVFLIALVLIVSVLFFSALTFALALLTPAYRGTSPGQLARNPSTLVIIPAMALTYAVVLVSMYFLIARLRHQPFWEAIGWRWPRGASWALYWAGGGMLAVGIGLLSKLLPIPKSLPMDRLFRDRSDAYLMAVFGIAVAPLVEELLFRGFLYPVLDRWLRNVLAKPERTRRGRDLVLALAGWGYLTHRLHGPIALLLLSLPLLVTMAAFLVKSRRVGGSPQVVILPGVCFLVWGVVTHSLSEPTVILASLIFAGLALALTVLGLARALSGAAAGLGRISAIVLTAGGFASVHGSQLGQAWGPMLVLFIVGLVLTVTRAVTGSVARGFLVHVGYNTTLFALLYFATDHFRHMERMAQ